MRTLHLPANIQPLLEAKGATRDAPMPLEALTALLRQRGYIPHAAVLAFESAFGGLTWTEEGDELGWLIGAGACLSADPAYGTPRGSDEPGFDEAFALVPVAYAATDWIALMDAEGVVWGQDLIGDFRAMPIAEDGVAFVSGLVTRAGRSDGPAVTRRRGELAAWLASRPPDEADR